MKRFLDCTASDFATMSKEDLLAAIAASEGRILVCETILYGTHRFSLRLAYTVLHLNRYFESSLTRVTLGWRPRKPA